MSSIYQEPKKNQVSEAITSYSDKYADSRENDRTVDHAKERVDHAETTTETFYNLVTDFYEYGWGESFHFAPVYDDKAYSECIAEYEREAGRLIGAKPGMTVVDVGCGVGGPGREVAHSSGANVVGLNYNAYQIDRAKKHTRKANLDHVCTYIKGDFCDLSDIQDNTYDGAFAFEATCHAKDPVIVYKEILRIMKPGTKFAEMAWAMTDDYDPENTEHHKSKHDVMFGNSLPEIKTVKEILATMREAGFEIMEFKDLEKDGDCPWYNVLENRSCCTVKDFRMSTTGRLATRVMVGVLETVSLAPKGTAKVISMLEVAAKSLVESGKLKIFTPMFRVVARKPDLQQ